MTLPFRRRHNDHEASHDRARAIVAMSFIEPTEPADAAWLAEHLAGCRECATDASAYHDDRELLRGLRDDAPQPPRDLWARTAASIEREAGRHERPSSAPGGAPGRHRTLRIGRVPVGALSGVLVILVVIGVSLVPRAFAPSVSTPPGTDVAAGSPVVVPTQIAVNADALAWVQVGADGSYNLVQANLSAVCPSSRDGCAPLDTMSSTRLNLSQAPQSVVLSPTRQQIVVITAATGPTSGTDVVVVPVPTPAPTPSLAPSASPDESTPPPPASPTPSAPIPTATPLQPTGSPGATASAGPSASAPASAGVAIVTGVVVVGDAVYSPDGRWLAFSARPASGGAGPDLYVWRVGDALATAVTSDHRTFFAGWLGNRILASRIEPAAGAPDASPTPGSSGSPKATREPTATPGPTATPNSSPAASDGSPAPTAIPVEEHPVSFILDPSTSVVTPLAGTDIWHPTVDPTGTFLVYWAGTLVPDGSGTGWTLGTGRLVLDHWQNGEPAASGGPSASSQPSSAPSAVPAATPAGRPSGSPAASDLPSPTPAGPAFGPAGTPVLLADGSTRDFDAWFDPSGTHLAVWIANPSDPNVGTLRLVVLDHETGAIDPAVDPLPGVAALRGVSIDEGRLAWVTPPGQDGQNSHVQVLAWNGSDFGQVRTVPADRLFVVR